MFQHVIVLLQISCKVQVFLNIHMENKKAKQTGISSNNIELKFGDISVLLVGVSDRTKILESYKGNKSLRILNDGHYLMTREQRSLPKSWQ